MFRPTRRVELPRRPPTPEFRLRSPRIGDAPAIARLCADEGVARMTGRMPHPYRYEDAERYLSSVLSVEPTETVFAVELKFENGSALAGLAGWAPIAHEGQVEFGYWLGRPFWGRGVMTAAAAKALARAFADPTLERAVAGTFKDNGPSIRVLQKLGFSLIGEAMRASVARGGEAPAWSWALTRDQWDAARKTTGTGSGELRR